ncbi:unnamed protein product [Urochloa decumbens]|uniref:Uncharacterized protein n=1 Tax=Urochloa decumbens TaxID=240449 RepID=A0ABC8VUM3_9POAL
MNSWRWPISVRAFPAWTGTGPRWPCSASPGALTTHIDSCMLAWNEVHRAQVRRGFQPSRKPQEARPSLPLSRKLQAVSADRAAMSPVSSHGEHFAEVVVVRHGQTDWNVSGIIQGRMDPELNETGRQQAAMVARQLSKEAKPAAVYSSDLKRAAETAQMIAAACCVVSDLVFDPALTERHMGLFQGWSVDDAKRSEAYEAFSRGGRDQELPGGGESLDQLSERCVSRLNEIAKKHKGERVVVVTHEAVIKEICRHADATSSGSRQIPNTSISVVHVSGSDGRWILEKFGDVGHLNEDGSMQWVSDGDGTSA